MIKLKVKDMKDNYRIFYKIKKTCTQEHLVAIAKLYLNIKQNTDISDEVIKNEIEKIVKNMKGCE